ncbi:MAG: hypothetical protein KAX44_00015 [Candidatus Brocadiae bacterium]|nr:hypothetical protein [Candidatus Brocadiia bacterium]
MNALAAQLTHAYRREEALYGQVMDLVDEQRRIMETEPDPSEVLLLCQQVEALMVQIEEIEAALQPARQQWQRNREDADGQLDAVLASVESVIAKIAELQRCVQQKLLAYMEGQKERTEGARAAINARKARRLYRAG